MNGVRVQIVRFADDIVIIAQGEINLKRTLGSLDGILKRNYKMEINRIKTEVMVCSKNPENINIKMKDNDLKQVSKFKYIGSIFTEDGKNKEGIIRVKKLKLYLIIKSNDSVRIALFWK